MEIANEGICFGISSIDIIHYICPSKNKNMKG